MTEVTSASQRPRALDTPTLIGISAVLMWSGTIGLYRQVSEIFGPISGAALIFTVSGLIAVLHSGRAGFRGHSPRYLLWGGAMFVTYEIALALAVGFAQDRSQSVEVGLVNHLWPCLTIALAVTLGEAKASVVIIPGVLLCLFGVVWASAGGENFSPQRMMSNIAGNPVAYALALLAALTWPFYTIFTRRMAKGRSAVPLFLLLTALPLWLHYAISDEPALQFHLGGAVMVAVMGLLTTLAYTAWTYGVARGNLTVVASASYFSPLLSVLLSSFLLQMSLGRNFWLGALAVTLGSLLCWYAARD